MLTAADIMTRSVVCAKPNDTVAIVARLLSDHDISAVPVCDASGAVIGMISEGDLIAPVGEQNIARRTWWLGLLADGMDLAPSFLDCIKVENRSVGDLMVSPVITASPETTVPQLADLLVKHHVKRLPIVKDGKLVGIVSRADLVQAFARTPDAIVEAL
ncbi:MAG TPA: CBS domain-containing protein [Rhodopila sp.]|uniref:CBS domain-containing protein n=1 Tax=Rhodopila sp. TaxID=2480087 RepID=UPI002BDDC5BA|nr:CBS domain-containing protein [Rhodopila sp.]HVY14115.1 CBS domain-containing protein [Rhodopila sp.]